MSGRRVKTASMHFAWVPEFEPRELNAENLGIVIAQFGGWDDIGRQRENEKRLGQWSVKDRRAKEKRKNAPPKPKLIPFKEEGKEPLYEVVILVTDCTKSEENIYQVFLRVCFVDANNKNFELDLNFEVVHHKITRESTDDDFQIPVVVKDYGSKDDKIITRRQFLIANIGSHIAKEMNDRIGKLSTGGSG